MRKKLKKIIIILILLVAYVYVYNIEVIPNNIVMLEGECVKLNLAYGLSFKSYNYYQTKLASSNLNKESINNTSKVNLNLFGNFTVKSVNVNIIENTKIIPLGTAIGMKLYTKGVLVVGMSEIENENYEKKKPYANCGIEEGDSIISINDNEVNNTSELIEQINKSNGKKLKIRYIKDDNVLETSIIPVKSDDKYKIGLWVRDAAAGVGTLTFYEPSNGMFMCLGHGIMDIDTEKIVEISSGELVTAKILSIIKGEKNSPGEIRGTINNGYSLGKIYKNTNMGVYGKLSNKQYANINRDEVEVASRNEITNGKATLICQLDNEEPKEYEIEIDRIYVNNNSDNKSMLIKITDQVLLEKTGGIIQGMSGSPILQNGKFIGAVTNVLVKDPTKGYAIFGDLLIKQLKEAI